jgi:calcineurin-like phosphoesterase family protein
MQTWLNENTFIISDTHFGDFASIANGFENYIINNWNKAVSENDTVLHLGDFTSDDDMSNMERKIEKYAKLLNGRIILIKGNHDTAVPFTYEKNGIEFLDDVIINEHGSIIDKGIISAATGTFNGLKILFSHYPVKDLYAIAYPPKWPSQDYGYIPKNDFEDAISCLAGIFTRDKFDLNIHGHIHEKISLFKNLINVSLDNIGYAPLRLG